MSPMNGENIAGAVIAAVIFFLGSLVTLMSQAGVVTISDISQAAWVSVFAGTLVAFLKDYQALTVRRWTASNLLNRETLYPKQNYPKAYGLEETTAANEK